MAVTSSWDKLKHTADYRTKAGEMIFLRVFALEPSARALFKFTEDEDIQANPAFHSHAMGMVDMIETAVELLGPDLEPLEADLKDLGKRHIGYGVSSDYFPVMERSVMYTLEEILGDKLTKSDRAAWQEIFHFMISNMTKGMKN